MLARMSLLAFAPLALLCSSSFAERVPGATIGILTELAIGSPNYGPISGEPGTWDVMKNQVYFNNDILAWLLQLDETSRVEKRSCYAECFKAFGEEANVVEACGGLFEDFRTRDCLCGLPTTVEGIEKCHFQCLVPSTMMHKSARPAERCRVARYIRASMDGQSSV